MPRRFRRRGFSIIEIVTALAVIAVLTGILLSNLNPETPNDRARYDAAADALQQLGNAIAASEPTKKARSFHQVVGVYPSKLSHLTTPITTADANLCGTSYTGTTAGTQTDKWAKAANPFWGRQLLTTGTPIAPGFIVQDVINRVYPVATTAGNRSNLMQLIMRGTTLADAQGLDLAVDGAADGTSGTITYSSTDPTDVKYNINFFASSISAQPALC